MWETIAVIAIVAVFILFAARALWRTLTGRDTGCSACGMCVKAPRCGEEGGLGSAAMPGGGCGTSGFRQGDASLNDSLQRTGHRRR